MRKGLVTEAAIVGGSLMAISAVVMPLARRADPERRVPIQAWVFLAGALTHFAWEAVGGNRWFAENYSKRLAGR